MKIIEVTNEIVVNIDLANAIDCRSKKQEKINERLKFQNLALVKTIELESLMEIAYRDNNQESRHIDDDKMNYWVGLLLELRGLIRKWREKNAVRLTPATLTLLVMLIPVVMSTTTMLTMVIRRSLDL